jgi:DNA-binding CsgD family transcriptional regulator
VDDAGLLERDRELATIARAIEALQRGEGGVVLVEGVAGIGKTSLMIQARAWAAAGAVSVLTATGGELESDFPYGVVRQLFEPAVRELAASEREGLFAGAAAPAARIVAPDATPTAAGGDPLTIQHGLYWLTVNAAARSPLLIAVDDVHWADAASLRVLLFLSRRLEGVPALLVLAARAGDAGAGTSVLAQLAAQPLTRALRPAALSEAAVGTLIERGLGSPDQSFVSACHSATGGTPYLVGELVEALAADGIAPVAGSARLVQGFAPATIGHATLLRLSRLEPGAVPLANAVAVLGADARLWWAARIAGLEEAEALAAADALAAAHILRPGRPLEFVHPIVRAAVYGQIPRGARSAAHAHAAELLIEARADVDAIAAHLLLTEPAGHASVIGRLRDAAREALARGAPEAAVTYLQRALEECVEPRIDVLEELALAETVVRAPAAAEHLQEALRHAGDPGARARLSLELAEILGPVGQWTPAFALLESALTDLGDDDSALSARAKALWVGFASYDPRHDGVGESRLSEVLAEAERGEGGRSLALVLAARAATRGEGIERVPSLVEAGLDGGRFLAEEGPESNLLPQALTALVFVEALDAAAALAEAVLRDARARGSVLGFATGVAHRAFVQVRRGDLAAAEADLRSALGVLQEHDLLYAIPITLWYASDAILERPDLADVAALAGDLQLPPDFAATVSGAWLLDLRGRLRLLARDDAGAVEDLRRCGETLTAVGHRNPNYCAWRSGLALATRDPDVVQDELADARRLGVPRAIGVSLRTLALIEGDLDGLREAVAVLEHSPARLEHARALVELGAALRRANRRSEAREALRPGLDLATRCGAQRLAERALEELAASGARPRREVLRGVDALTPSERRVAAMAAEGLSNAQIAQALFVTVNTIETHLRHVYAKLGINVRVRLAEALKITADP